MSKHKPRKIPEAKPEFIERMKKLLSGKDLEEYFEILKTQPVNSIRCNTLKISPEELKKRLKKSYNWKISQPWTDYPEVMIITNELLPGEIGRSLEHLLGYYYVQELASMLPIIALSPQPEEKIIDLCAAPGSKTTQTASMMKNSGLIIANEVSMGRMRILASNLERCGVTNTIITRKDGIALCTRLREKMPHLKFSKILVDAPCSGEGTLRSAYKTYDMWNEKVILSLSRLQKQLFEAAFELLEENGEMIYSTCTHAPEENEGIINWAIEKFKEQIEIEEVKLPVICRPGIQEWDGDKFNKEVEKACRVYPQDNNTEGFFLTKIRKVK